MVLVSCISWTCTCPTCLVRRLSMQTPTWRLSDRFVDARADDGCLCPTCVCRCTTLPITAMTFANGEEGSAGVSQNINVIYHAPASLQVFPPLSSPSGNCVLKEIHDNRGDKLRLINTSTTIGARTWSGRIEVSSPCGGICTAAKGRGVDPFFFQKKCRYGT